MVKDGPWWRRKQVLNTSTERVLDYLRTRWQASAGSDAAATDLKGGGIVPAGVPLVIVTGLSGAGKSQALRALEDIGFYCVDNLPPDRLLKFVALFSQTRERGSRVALGIDIRGGDFFNSLFAALEDLEREGFDYEILFLEAQEDVLIRRFKETRRPHPLAMPGRLLDGIRLERERLQELRGRAQIVIDTSHKTPRELREEMARTFASPENRRLAVQLIPFGYKHAAAGCDLVMTCAFCLTLII